MERGRRGKVEDVAMGGYKGTLCEIVHAINISIISSTDDLFQDELCRCAALRCVVRCMDHRVKGGGCSVGKGL